MQKGNQVSTEDGEGPQQINLFLTLHLDCINVELGSIMAIGRT